MMMMMLMGVLLSMDTLLFRFYLLHGSLSSPCVFLSSSPIHSPPP